MLFPSSISLGALTALALVNTPPALAAPPANPPPANPPPANPPPAEFAPASATSGAAAKTEPERAEASARKERERREARESADAPIDADAERRRPDYDGRPDSASVGDVALWVPRVVLFPVYLAFEYLVRQPLGFVATNAEKHKVPTKIIDFFTFGEERQAGLFPAILLDLGFRPDLGLYFFANDVGIDGHDIRARGSWFGERFFSAKYAERFPLGPDTTAALHFDYVQRPDQRYYGLGPRTERTAHRYQIASVAGWLRLRNELGHRDDLEVDFGVRRVALDGSETCCGDPPVDQGVASGALQAAPGMNESFTVAFQRAELTLDTRPTRHFEELEIERDASDFLPAPGHGLRLRANGELAHALNPGNFDDSAPTAHQQWVRYGGSLMGFADVSGVQQQSLGLGVYFDFADPLNQITEVPITQLPALGETQLPGFGPGRLQGRSAAVARLQYTWPVWAWLDGELHYSVGNVFGEHLDGFEPGLLRSSFGIAMQTSSAADLAFGIITALGTRPFDEGSGIDSFRLAIGTTTGF